MGEGEQAVSFEAMAIALHHSRARGSAKLVLLGIANHDGDGGAWPAISTLARYAGVSGSQAQKLVGQLVGLGEIRRHVQAGGTRDMEQWQRPNRYDFLLVCPPDCDRTKNHRTVKRSAMVLPAFGEQLPAQPGEPGDTPEPVDNPVSNIVDNSPRPPRTSRPPSIHRGGPPRVGRALTNPYNQSHDTHRPTNVIARAKLACGHEAIDDRHCVVGCRPKDER